MTITKTLDGTNLTIALEGRLDTTTSPQLEGEMHPDIDSATEVAPHFVYGSEDHEQAGKDDH